MNALKIVLALGLAFSLPATAETYYFAVLPHAAKAEAAQQAIKLALSPVPLPEGGVLVGYGGFDFLNVLAVTGDATYDPAQVTWTHSGSLPAGVSFTGGELSGTPTKDGTFTFSVQAAYKGKQAEQAYTMIVQPAADCLTLKQLDTSRADGVYTVHRPEGNVPVYCDMTTDGGGWTLTQYSSAVISDTTYDVTVGQSMVQGLPLKTATSDAAGRPVLPNGTSNAFKQVLFKGGNSSWQSLMGTWVRWSTVPNVTPIPSRMPGALTSNGKTAVYRDAAAWPMTGWRFETTAPLGLWDANGNSNLCGGYGQVGSKSCPIFGWDYQVVAYHYDAASRRELYVR